MVTHWESSRRPLYVRTIWKDGQHHVILDKTKENYLDTPSSRRSKPSSSQFNHRATRSAGSAVNFNVSSVRVLLSGIRRFKSGGKETRTRNAPQTFTRIGGEFVSCKNLNNEVTFEAIRGLPPPSLKKRNSAAKDLQTTPKVSSDNALSKKVMNWLDLSKHSDRKQAKLKKECFVDQQSEELPECCVFSQSPKTEDSSVLKKSPKQSGNNQEIIVYSSEEVQLPDEEHFYHVLTPRTTTEEYTYEEEYNADDPSERKVDCERRQLHIFMPNLPKKSSDCGSSIFSSKLSVNCR
ncbi:hypothetical protein HUJ04_006084 [Dendroctonus ponderosae]|nr:hypothetical protein HUJ04_006084 [Dendroctonus ponderosae]